MPSHLNFKFGVQTSKVLISIKVSLYIISTSKGLFLLLSLDSTQLKTNCHQRRKRISGEYWVSLAKNYFQHQSLLAEFLKSSTQLLKLKTV